MRCSICGKEMHGREILSSNIYGHICCDCYPAFLKNMVAGKDIICTFYQRLESCGLVDVFNRRVSEQFSRRAFMRFKGFTLTASSIGPIYDIKYYNKPATLAIFLSIDKEVTTIKAYIHTEDGGGYFI